MLLLQRVTKTSPRLIRYFSMGYARWIKNPFIQGESKVRIGLHLIKLLAAFRPHYFIIQGQNVYHTYYSRYHLRFIHTFDSACLKGFLIQHACYIIMTTLANLYINNVEALAGIVKQSTVYSIKYLDLKSTRKSLNKKSILLLVCTSSVKLS